MSHTRRTTRLASEGAVIVVSILLAFWIDAWWDNRQARMTEMTVLESIREEVEENRLELDRLLGLNGTRVQITSDEIVKTIDYLVKIGAAARIQDASRVQLPASRIPLDVEALLSDPVFAGTIGTLSV